MDGHYQFATRDELWRLQEDLREINSAQAQQSERISRLEKRKDEDNRMRNVWGPQSPFPSGIASTSQDYNPAAEAFRNFESESQSGMMGSLHLDHDDDRRRGTSRANSVRFDESAMNHYGTSSRQSLDMLPVRTGSGMGMSERSYSHRSDGKNSTSGQSMRANSFGLESSRLLGSTAMSPRAVANPPPGFLFLGPVPSIIRCWLSDDFSNDSVLYAAICTGSYESSISRTIVRQLGLEEEVSEESGSLKIKLSISLTEATIQHSSSARSSSPAPQVPSLAARFNVYEAAENDRSIQVFLGSDILRPHNADILFSEDRLLIFDDERNRLAVPLIRPESESAYRSLSTLGTISSHPRTGTEKTASRTSTNGQHTGAIQPPRFDLQDSTTGSSAPNSPAILPNSNPAEFSDQLKSETDTVEPRKNEDVQVAGGSGSEKSFTASKSQASSASAGVWGNSWRSSGSGASSSIDPSATKSASGYARAGTGRSMKVLRPGGGKSMASLTRASSTTGPSSSPWGVPAPPASDKVADTTARLGQTSLADATNKPNATSASSTRPEAQPSEQSQTSAPTKSNPIGQASAFGWLNSGGGR